MTERDLVLIMKVARIGLAMVFDEIAEELGISMSELDRIRDLVVESTDEDEYDPMDDFNYVGSPHHY